MKNFNFFNLLEYNDSRIPQVEQYLNFLLNNQQFLNGFTVDLIDYEKLIAIEQQEKDNEKIQILLKELKEIIANNYFEKNKLFKNIFPK